MTPEIEAFRTRCETVLGDLFDQARDANEVYRAFALMTEMRGLSDPGWNTTEESKRAFTQYHEILEELDTPERQYM